MTTNSTFANTQNTLSQQNPFLQLWTILKYLIFSRAIFAVITALLIIAISIISAGIATDGTTKAQVPGVYTNLK